MKKGSKMTLEQRENIRRTTIEGMKPLEIREKCRKGRAGKKHTLKWKKEIRKLMIERTQSPEVRRMMSKREKGPLNHNWKGGISFVDYPPEYTKELREKILTRDNYECKFHENQQECKGKLEVHHIDYNKKNCDPSNLITVCTRVNAKVNFNRTYWAKFFQTKYANLLQQKLP